MTFAILTFCLALATGPVNDYLVVADNPNVRPDVVTPRRTRKARAPRRGQMSSTKRKASGEDTKRHRSDASTKRRSVA